MHPLHPGPRKAGTVAPRVWALTPGMPTPAVLEPGLLGLLLVGLACLALSAACAPSSMRVEGRAGQAVPLARTGGGVPYITAIDAEGNEHHFAVDTGHPHALLVDVDAFPGLPLGATSPLDLRMFGLTFYEVPAHAVNLFQDHVAVGLSGILGYEVLADYTLTLDLLNGWASLSRPFTPVEWPPEVEAGPPHRAPFTLAGVNNSRPVLTARIEGAEVPVFIDTGAFSPVVYPPLLDVIDADPSRPRIGGLRALSAQGVIEGYITRLGTFELVTPFGAAAHLDNMAVVVFPERVPPEDLAGLGVGLSIASGVLERYVAEIDYASSELRLSAHDDTSWWLPNPFIGPGFSFGLYANGWFVNGVYPGTPAADTDIQSGDRFRAIDDIQLEDLTVADMFEIRRAFVPGEEFAFTFLRDGELFTETLAIVDVLPFVAEEGVSADEPAP